MLYMVVMKHNPEAGPMGSENVRNSLKNVMQQRNQVLSKLEIKDIGEWIDIPGHTAYLLADATDAHVFTRMLAELGLLSWMTAEIHPVVPYQEAASIL